MAKQKEDLPLFIKVEKLAKKHKLSTHQTIAWMNMTKAAYIEGVKSATRRTEDH